MIKKSSRKPTTLFLTAIMIAVLSFTFIGCGGKKKAATTPQVSGTAKEIYEKAKNKIKKNPERARLLFKEVMHLYPDSLYAQRAKIGVADAYFNQKDAASRLMAAQEYQEYVNLYPNSPDAVYAKFQVANCYYKQIRRAGRDQDNTLKALNTLDAMIKMYPDTNEAVEAKKMLEECRQTLAKHYFLIGVSNFRLGALRGALARFKQVIDSYPDFKENDRLFYYTGRTYVFKRDYDTAVSFFQRVVTNYPKSKYFKRAQKRLENTMRLKAQAEKAEGAKKAEGAEKAKK